MRNKAIINKEEILTIIKQSKTCFVAMVDENGFPYNLPFNFGFDKITSICTVAAMEKK